MTNVKCQLLLQAVYLYRENCCQSTLMTISRSGIIDLGSFKTHPTEFPPLVKSAPFPIVQYMTYSPKPRFYQYLPIG